MFSRSFLSLVAAATLVSANNDWSVPCFTGVCEYDLPASAAGASGTLKIWGAANAIADITPAAGWEILNCAPDAISQDIRLVCKDGSDAACARLYETGAEGKVVRLPESCGANAFAVISKAYTPEDQTIPATLVRRDGTQPQVRALQLDNNFQAAQNRRGSAGAAINFAIRGANVPGANGAIAIPTNVQKRFMKRQDGGLGGFFDDVLEEIQKLNDFNVDENIQLPPIRVNDTFNLLNEAVACPPLEQARLKVDVKANAVAQAALGVVVSGTVVPPKIDQFAITSNMNANVDGTLSILAGATGVLDSGEIPLFSIGIPGLDFPGVFTLGPTFDINAQAIARLDLNLGLDVGLKYNARNAQFTFPPRANTQNGGNFHVADTPLKLSATPNVAANGTLEAHLIPSLNLGIDALGGIAQAKVFLALDASATLELTFQAQTGGSVEIPVGGGNAGNAPPAGNGGNNGGFPIGTLDPILRDSRIVRRGTQAPGWYLSEPKATPPPAAVPRPAGHEAPARRPAHAPPAAPQRHRARPRPHAPPKKGGQGRPPAGGVVTPPEAETSFGGCVKIGAGLDVKVGADADFFGIFNESTEISLFQRDFELFQRCFGNVAPSAPAPLPEANQGGAGGLLELICPAPEAQASPLVDIASGVLAAAEIREVGNNANNNDNANRGRRN